ncbi:serine/threonine-protein kinase [aff. Roholtiella sp. LEGE 12411]|uniref:serine/threonine-protein kinase n=1 Tax=aff. Roholtiella sp. LEGE 12411 TaxID=1828822 RepID=UPI001FC7D721|nr:serine/threonine-protein kinase [aff. Roholtiella sp. LEGE 12411]
MINGRIRLLRPLRSLEESLYAYTNVFEVEDAGTELHLKPQIRVMKVLKWSEPKLVELVQREARILQLIQHPGIPQSTRNDYFTFKLKDTLIELHCLVMEKVEGENLREWLKTYGRIPQNVALDWFSQLINILDIVHRSGFFHRDIKPENIIHQPDGKLVLVDFGAAREITSTYLAKISTSGGSSTGLGSGHEITSVITPFFTPIEQINGMAVPQSDFYALGCTFVNLLTGISLMELPTDEQTGRLKWRKHAPQINQPFANLLDDLMTVSPGKRPQSTQVILERLERLPFQSKINRIIKSKLFGLTVFGLFLLVFAGVCKGYNLALSNYYFNEASRYLNEPKKSRKYYELAIKHNRKDVAAYSNLALACQQLSDITCVTENYEKTFKLKPNTWEARYGLANFYDDQGKYDLAEQQYKLAIQYSNNQAMNAVSNLARIKNRQKKYSEAAALALQGLSSTKNPEWQAGLYKNLGWARFKQQRYAEAEDYLQKSVKLNLKRIDAYCLLAQTYEALGNLSKAKIYWEVCLLSRSGLPEVQEWREQVLRRLLQKN